MTVAVPVPVPVPAGPALSPLALPHVGVCQVNWTAPLEHALAIQPLPSPGSGAGQGPAYAASSSRATGLGLHPPWPGCGPWSLDHLGARCSIFSVPPLSGLPRPVSHVGDVQFAPADLPAAGEVGPPCSFGFHIPLLPGMPTLPFPVDPKVMAPGPSLVAWSTGHPDPFPSLPEGSPCHAVWPGLSRQGPPP